MEIIAALTILNILSIIICHTVAKKRGANPVFWGFIGALFSILAIPFVMRAKPMSN